MGQIDRNPIRRVDKYIRQSSTLAYMTSWLRDMGRLVEIFPWLHEQLGVILYQTLDLSTALTTKLFFGLYGAYTKLKNVAFNISLCRLTFWGTQSTFKLE